MDVRSAFNSGLTGFQDASAQLSNASSRIAQAGTAEKSMANVQSQASEIFSPSAERAPISITTELINLKIATLEAKSAANVINTADEMLGTLIDTSV
jgi:flagellar hook protein FlgE